MPCEACGAEIDGLQSRDDPLRWDLDPPCSESEWLYMGGSLDAPEFVKTQKHVYMNKICRQCYNLRFDASVRIRHRIRDRGGIEEMNPTKQMQQEYDAVHATDLVARRPACIHGLQSEAAAPLNGKYCKLLSKDMATERWTVELVDGQQKSIKESSLEASKDIDREYEMAKAMHMLEHLNSPSGGKRTGQSEEKRPLGENTLWPKVKGLHPGAVVRLKGLSAAELNGRKGRCISFNQENGRWTVDLGDGQKALRIDNLVPAPGEKPPTVASAREESKTLKEADAKKETMNAKEVFAESYGWDG